MADYLRCCFVLETDNIKFRVWKLWGFYLSLVTECLYKVCNFVFSHSEKDSWRLQDCSYLWDFVTFNSSLYLTNPTLFNVPVPRSDLELIMVKNKQLFDRKIGTHHLQHVLIYSSLFILHHNSRFKCKNMLKLFWKLNSIFRKLSSPEIPESVRKSKPVTSWP